MGGCGEIESAVQNLLSNAFKYTSQNGRIELAVSEAEIDGRPYCLVTVSDNGVGIPDDLQQHVFDSFVQENVSRNIPHQLVLDYIL